MKPEQIEKYKQYRRKQIAELADWSVDMDMTGVSISDADLKSGSPKIGDKIARNPKNHQDRWLVANDYFMDNFEPADIKPSPSEFKVIDNCEAGKYGFPIRVFEAWQNGRDKQFTADLKALQYYQSQGMKDEIERRVLSAEYKGENVLLDNKDFLVNNLLLLFNSQQKKVAGEI